MFFSPAVPDETNAQNQVEVQQEMWDRIDMMRQMAMNLEAGSSPG